MQGPAHVLHYECDIMLMIFHQVTISYDELRVHHNLDCCCRSLGRLGRLGKLDELGTLGFERLRGGGFVHRLLDPLERVRVRLASWIFHPSSKRIAR